MFGILSAMDGGLLDLLTLGGYLDGTAEFWLWSTLLLLIAEIFTAGFFLGALAICTLLTAGGALWFSPGWQVAFFAASSIGSLLWVRPVFANLLSPKKTATNTSALLGQAGTVVVQVPAGGQGRVRLANEEWRATAAAELNVGDAVKVLAVAGNTLTVDRA
ncbi:MAG: NfeD family protein [Planctomycetota bacterium]|nr:MAG: NfeD family protein [Planctomycetota bacterium]